MKKHLENTNDNQGNIPLHIGIIMDGNGRWAKQKLQERSYGHLNGIQAVKDSLIVALEYQIPFVSLYVFSTENWKRPKHEVKFILDTVSGNLKEHYQFYKEHSIHVVHSGNTNNLDSKILDELETVRNDTKHNTGLTLNLAFNYGGRDEIIRSMNKYLKDKNSNTPLTEATFTKYLDNPDIPDVDLMIRTGAEKRISNFLLWQIAYAELFFSDVLWPEWSQDNMREAIEYYKSKHRRFGGV